MIEAMDTEGLDIAVVFRTYTAHATGTDDIEPDLAAAICRAFNNWLRDFCNANPSRLLPTAQMALHDVELSVIEARRAVKELGDGRLGPAKPSGERPAFLRSLL